MWNKYMLVFFNLLAFAFAYAQIVPRKGITDEEWKGNWFPTSPGLTDTNAEVKENDLLDEKHGVKMGVFSNCDDGKMNLTVDWNGSPEAHTCFSPTWNSINEFSPDYNLNPISSCDNIPKNYWAQHACMNQTIEYDHDIPTFGTHRPLWAKYGEYEYLPKQRWLHNVEHGAVVMLYHPCADKTQIKLLKYLVKKCLYRHIITPYNLLSPERPLALVTWGCRLTMSVVDQNVVTSFIKAHALRGPERVSRNGQFDKEFKTPAAIVTDHDDSQLCPNINL